MPTYTLKIGQSKNLTLVDPHDSANPYQHPILAIVGNGAYMSKIDVPAGTAITDTAYWSKAFEGGMLFKGTYASALSYYSHASVHFNNGVYVCKVGETAAPGEDPSSAPSKWHKVMDMSDVTFTASSLLFTDDDGAIETTPIIGGNLNFDGTNLAFLPPVAPAIGRVTALALPVGTADYGSAFIGSDDMIYTCGYTASNVYHNSHSSGNHAFYLPRVEDIPHTGNWKGICNNYTTLYAWTTTGELYTMGYNGYGQLGLGDTTARYGLTQVMTTGVDWATVNGFSDTVNSGYVVMDDGTMKACGYNSHGQLGIGTTSTTKTFTTCVGFTGKVIEIATPECRYGVMIRTDKSGDNVFSAGYGSHGALAQGNSSASSSFGAVAIRAIAIAMSGGYSSYMSSNFIKESDGNLYGSGYCSHYAVGNGSTGTKYAPTASTTGGATGGFTNLFTNGSYGFNGFASKALVPGKIWCWGYGSYGSLGHGTTGHKTSPFETTFASTGYPVKVQLVSNYQNKTSYMLTSNGEVWVSGYNGYSQNGNGTAASNGWKKVPTGKLVATDICLTGTSQYSGCDIIFSDGNIGHVGYAGHGEGGTGTTSPGYSLTLAVL